MSQKIRSDHAAACLITITKCEPVKLITSRLSFTRQLRSAEPRLTKYFGQKEKLDYVSFTNSLQCGLRGGRR